MEETVPAHKVACHLGVELYQSGLQPSPHIYHRIAASQKG